MFLFLASQQYIPLSRLLVLEKSFHISLQLGEKEHPLDDDISITEVADNDQMIPDKRVFNGVVLDRMHVQNRIREN